MVFVFVCVHACVCALCVCVVCVVCALCVCALCVLCVRCVCVRCCVCVVCVCVVCVFAVSGDWVRRVSESERGGKERWERGKGEMGGRGTEKGRVLIMAIDRSGRAGLGESN